MHADDAPRFLTIAQAARRLAVSERTVRRMIAAGELAHRRVSNRLVRIPVDEFETYEAEREAALTPPTHQSRPKHRPPLEVELKYPYLALDYQRRK